MDTFFVSSFGMFVMALFQPLFNASAWQSFAVLACGWALSTHRHTISNYLWLTGATTLKHFSRFYVFVGGPLYTVRWQLWARIVQHAATQVPQDEPIVVELDDFTKKKAGRHIEGLARYRNAAGSARQEYRTLRGLNFVLGILRLPLATWPEHRVTLPIGLELYLKAPLAKALKRLYHSRSTLARAIVDFVAQTLPGRGIRVVTDGGYATKDFLRHLPASVHVVSHLLITAQLYEAPKARKHLDLADHRSKASPSAQPKPWRGSERDGSITPQKPTPRSKVGWGCGIVSFQADSSVSWWCVEAPRKRPQRRAGENPDHVWKPFSPPT